MRFGGTPLTTMRRPARDRRSKPTTVPTVALRRAFYARYSSDQQRAVSVNDQFRVCRMHAERVGRQIADA